MAKKVNPTGLPWFPFYAAAWLGSETVLNMTMTERGIYITLMAMCWEYGSLNWDSKCLAKRMRIDPRTIGTFMAKYTNLTQSLHTGSTEVTLPKVQEFSETLVKNGGGANTEQRRGEKTRAEQTEPEASVSVSGSKPVQFSSRSQAGFPYQSVFNPLEFHAEITAVKSQRVYPPDEVRRILRYHFEFHPGYWASPKANITSVLRLSQAVDEMANQIPADWEPPAPKQHVGIR